MIDLRHDVFLTSPFDFEESSAPLSEVLNNDCRRKILMNGTEVSSDHQVEGTGSFTFADSNDYFEGQFHGCISNRFGHLTKFSDGGAITCGTWRDGLLEVNKCLLKFF